MAVRIVLLLPGILLAACATPPTAVTTNLSPPAVASAPITLIGATTGMLSATFGPPVLRRIDGSSQVWLYHSGVCALNLFLFPDSAGVPRVASAVPDGDPAACVASLQRQTVALERGTAS